MEKRVPRKSCQPISVYWFSISIGNLLYDVAKELKVTPQELKADNDRFNELVKRPNIERATAIAEAFLYEMKNYGLLTTIEPAFVAIGGLGKLQHEIPDSSLAVLNSISPTGSCFSNTLRKLHEIHRQTQ